MNPEVLCIGHGGLKGHIMLGLLQNLYDRKILVKVKKYIGTSVGSMICLLLACGYTPSQIFIAASSLNFDNLKIDLKSMIDDMGILSHSIFSNLIKDMILKKFDYIPTLKQLYYKHDIHFVAVATNINRKKATYFDYLKFPDLDCIKAIEMSSSIPGIFKKCEYKDLLYSDGVSSDPLPMSYFNDNKINILGIAVETIGLYNNSIFNYISNILETPLKEIRHIKEKELKSNCKIIEIKFSFADENDSSKLYSYGFEEGFKYYK